MLAGRFTSFWGQLPSAVKIEAPAPCSRGRKRGPAFRRDAADKADDKVFRTIINTLLVMMVAVRP